MSTATAQQVDKDKGIALAKEHGLSPSEYERLLAIVGRAPTLTEIGIFGAMWSEHCSYKSSKNWLRKLPTEGPQVICGPGENAGVVDIGHGQALVFKMESPQPPVLYRGPIRARRRASAASCATCSPWARARSPI